MNYKERALAIGQKKYGETIRIVSYGCNDKFEVVTMATPELERLADGLSYIVFAANKISGNETISEGILGLFENKEFDDLTLDSLTYEHY